MHAFINWTPNVRILFLYHLLAFSYFSSSKSFRIVTNTNKWGLSQKMIKEENKLWQERRNAYRYCECGTARPFPKFKDMSGSQCYRVFVVTLCTWKLSVSECPVFSWRLHSLLKGFPSQQIPGAQVGHIYQKQEGCWLSISSFCCF